LSQFDDFVLQTPKMSLFIKLISSGLVSRKITINPTSKEILLQIAQRIKPEIVQQLKNVLP